MPDPEVAAVPDQTVELAPGGAVMLWLNGQLGAWPGSDVFLAFTDRILDENMGS